MPKDVCDVLELQAPHMVAGRVEEDDRSTTSVIDHLGRSQQVTTVNESGLYDVIFQSRKPEAKRFRRWVTNEVLPAIRKTGAYISDSILDADDPWELLETHDKTLLYEAVLSKILRTAGQHVAAGYPSPQRPDRQSGQAGQQPGQ